MTTTQDDIAQSRLDQIVQKINKLCADEDVAVITTLFTPTVVCSSVQLETSWSLATGGGALHKLEVHFKKPRGVREDWHKGRVQDTQEMVKALLHALRFQDAQFEAVALHFPPNTKTPVQEGMERLPGKYDL